MYTGQFPPPVLTNEDNTPFCLNPRSVPQYQDAMTLLKITGKMVTAAHLSPAVRKENGMTMSISNNSSTNIYWALTVWPHPAEPSQS